MMELEVPIILYMPVEDDIEEDATQSLGRITFSVTHIEAYWEYDHYTTKVCLTSQKEYIVEITYEQFRERLRKAKENAGLYTIAKG